MGEGLTMPRTSHYILARMKKDLPQHLMGPYYKWLDLATDKHCTRDRAASYVASGMAYDVQDITIAQKNAAWCRATEDLPDRWHRASVRRLLFRGWVPVATLRKCVAVVMNNLGGETPGDLFTLAFSGLANLDDQSHRDYKDQSYCMRAAMDFAADTYRARVNGDAMDFGVYTSAEVAFACYTSERCKHGLGGRFPRIVGRTVVAFDSWNGRFGIVHGVPEFVKQGALCLRVGGYVLSGGAPVCVLPSWWNIPVSLKTATKTFSPDALPISGSESPGLPTV